MLAATLIATSARAQPAVPSTRAIDAPDTAPLEPLAVFTSELGGAGRLVVAPRDEALSLSVCVAPVRQRLDAALALAIAERGGEASRAAIDGVDVLCGALPSSELPFAVWFATHVVSAERAARDGEPDDADAETSGGAVDPSLVRAAAIALEGATDETASLPARFVVTLAGRVERTAAEQLAAARFDVTRPREPASRPAPMKPQQTTERMSALDADVASPFARYAWVVPEGSDDEAAIRVALEVLGGGEQARLPRLFQGTHLGKRAEAWELHVPGGTLSGLLIEPRARVSIDRIRRFVDGALKQLRLVGPSRRELARAKQRLLLDAYRTWEDPVALARLLASYELVRGGAERARSAILALSRVTPRDVSRAVQRSLVDARRTTIEVYPPSFPADDPRVAAQKLYTVVASDTLARIAERFHVSVAAIARANDLDPKYGLSEGQPLWIPVR
ncbi:MAG TPA: LysM peptidoglycan-binding domain-containing protein [Polyangiaceae bacterium]|nr:LysM peptidoglycan-binding domain-containing protein [Polyangiaceae bacterium]